MPWSMSFSFDTVILNNIVFHIHIGHSRLPWLFGYKKHLLISASVLLYLATNDDNSIVSLNYLNAFDFFCQLIFQNLWRLFLSFLFENCWPPIVRGWQIPFRLSNICPLTRRVLARVEQSQNMFAHLQHWPTEVPCEPIIVLSCVTIAAASLKRSNSKSPLTYLILM